MDRIYVLTFFIIFSSISYAQNQFSKWIFGNQVGLDFSNGSVQVVDIGQQLSTSEGCAMVSDNNGNLLFYTDGKKVWAKDHTLMPNANNTSWDKSLPGDASSTQSVIITPAIGNPNKYYIFSLDGTTADSLTGPKGKWDGLYYTVVDIKLNNGRGDIDTSYIHSLGYVGNKIPLIDSTGEKLTAIKHANNKDYWIIARKHFQDSIYAFLVTCNGVDSVPKISPTIHSWKKTTSSPWGHGPGYSRATHDGKALLEADYAGIVIYGFDNSLGKIISEDTVMWGLQKDMVINSMTGDTSFLVKDWFYGVEISPNDSFIYTQHAIFNSPLANDDTINILVFKRFAPDIYATKRVISAMPGSSAGTKLAALQAAPDGRIYKTMHDESRLSYIENPNSYSGSVYIHRAINLNSKICKFGLPNFFTTLLTWPQSFSLENNIMICPVTQQIQLGDSTATEYSFQWFPSNHLNDSTISNPIAIVDSAITFFVKTISVCDTFNDTINIYTYDLPIVKLPDDTTICIEEILEISPLEISEEVSYLWSTGDLSISTQVNESGIVWLRVTDENQCFKEDSIFITMKDCPDTILPSTIFFPNAFSPNQDGVNDIFFPIYQNVKAIEYFAIYNRWGNEIFITHSIKEGWDGTFKGVKQENGVYIYSVSLNMPTISSEVHSTTKLIKGNISLIR